MFNSPALLMAGMCSVLKKQSDALLTVGQGSGYSLVRNGRAYPLIFYGFSSGNLPISLLSVEASSSIVAATSTVDVFGSAPKLEKLGIKGVFSTSIPLRAMNYTWLYLSKDSPIWKSNYVGLKFFRTDIEIEDGESTPEDNGYLGGEDVRGEDVLYPIDPYLLFISSGEVLEERAFINADDLNKSIHIVVKLLTQSEVALNA